MPMRASDYHPDWPWIGRQIRRQAGDRCEFCGVVNGAVGARDRNGDWHDEDAIHHLNSDVGFALFGDWPEMIRIVLTTAHLCHDTACIDPTHLRALCQKCHLDYDRPRNVAKARETARRTRLERTGQTELAGIA